MPTLGLGAGRVSLVRVQASVRVHAYRRVRSRLRVSVR